MGCDNETEEVLNPLLQLKPEDVMKDPNKIIALANQLKALKRERKADLNSIIEKWHRGYLHPLDFFSEKELRGKRIAYLEIVAQINSKYDYAPAKEHHTRFQGSIIEEHIDEVKKAYMDFHLSLGNTKSIETETAKNDIRDAYLKHGNCLSIEEMFKDF